MENVLEKIKEIWGKFLEWWGKFTSKQKTTIIVVACVVVMAFAGLVMLLTNPNYTYLKTCETTSEASQVVAILDDNNIKYKVSDDGLRIQVPKSSLSSASLALGASGIVSDRYTLEQALSGSFTTTEADKAKFYQQYMEEHLAEDFIAKFNSVKSATVIIHMAENDGTLLSKNDETTVTASLDIEGDFTDENAAFLAKGIATALGLKNTDHIVIMDMDANLLFSGEDDTTVAGSASSQLGVKAEAEGLMNSKVRVVLQGTGEFGDIKVSTNLDIDFSTTEETTHTYTPADGQSQGVLSSDKNYTSSSEGGNSGPPGTDSNSESTYQYQDNAYSSSTIEEYYRTYLPNEYIKYTTIPAGTINYGKSSVAVSSVAYNVLKEEDAKARGLLDGIKWEEYKAANSERKQIAVPDDMKALVADATGISEDFISIVAYEENVFVDSEGLNIDVTDVVQIILIILILGLLAAVILRSMKSEKPEEEPEQLSVENLLQSNPENTLENIEMEETSETRKMIEKFVDENPEAVANLLRNWLNEEWG